MDGDFSLDISGAIENLLRGPDQPAREFVRNGATFGEVYSMAAGLQAAFTGAKQNNDVVCLATENRAVVAAALLCSLTSGPSLLLPYALSAKALQSARELTGFTAAITDTPEAFAGGIRCICPQAASGRTLQRASNTSFHEELLQIFTGGSTGSPQAWSKTGINIFGEGIYLAGAHGVNAQDRLLATIPPYHIYGLLFSVVLPLVCQASVIGESPVYPGEILDRAKEHEATVLISVPAHYRVLKDKRLPVRLAFSSAGMLDADVNREFSANNTGIIEVYGSTETGGIASRNRSCGEEFFTAFSTSAWKIVDERLAVHSPFVSNDLPVDGEGFFIANDRVEDKGENTFALKGRADTVTKVGGKRVDLDEIGQLIRRQPGVSDCAVTTLADPGGREHRICALIQGECCSISDIKKALAGNLEAYAHPRHYSTVDRIPVKDNGKYDWSAIHELLRK